MAYLNEQELKKQISSGEFSSVYLFFGDESYLNKHYASLIADKSVSSDFRDFNFHKFDGSSPHLDEIYEIAESIPMMGGRNCVLVNDLQVDKLGDGDFEILNSLLDDPSEYCVLILLMANVPFVKSNAKCKKVLKAIEKNGSICEFDKKSERELCEILERGAKKRSCVLDRSTASFLIDYVGVEMNTLLNELEKLCYYADNRQITRGDVEAVCIRSLDAGAFDLAKALTSGTAEKAFCLLDELFMQKIEPVVILGALVTAYADMYRVKAALESGARVEAAAEFFNYKGREFRLRNAGRLVARLTIAELRSCLEVLDRADEKLKSSAVDQRLVLEETILKLMVMTK